VRGILNRWIDEIFQAVKKRTRDAGLTVSIVEQRMAECLDIADRVSIRQTGPLPMWGSVAEMKLKPDVGKAYLGL
jgi:branched-chain amino acid transport system ATP-binding protein